MPIHMTARFSVKPESLDTCLRAIEAFIDYVGENESGTQIYRSLHEAERETDFLHYFIFDDEAAEERHRASEGVKQFTAILYPELASDSVEFKRYKVAASTK